MEAVAAQAAEAGTPLIAARENSKRQLKGFGKFAHIGVSVDTHHALKREEIVAEAAKIARRSNNDLGDAA